MIFSTCLIPGLQNQPASRIAVDISSVAIILSESSLRRTHEACEIIGPIFQACKKSHEEKISNANLILSSSRLNVLADQILIKADLSMEHFHIALVSDNEVCSSAEVLFEECICDYLSHFACFDDDESHAVCSASELCKDRLIALGFSSETSMDCMKQAKSSFLKDVSEFIELEKEDFLDEKNASVDSFDEGRMHTDNKKQNVSFCESNNDETKVFSNVEAKEDAKMAWDENSHLAISLDDIGISIKSAAERMESYFFHVIKTRQQNTFVIC